MYEIAVEDSFDAAHLPPGDDGACRRLHGHTYRVRAAFRFSTLGETGMAFDFRKAKGILKSVVDYVDHQYINELPEFSVQSPTAENIARFAFDRIKSEMAEIHSVSIWETPNSCATYYEEA